MAVTTERYSLAARLIHWLMAVGFGFMWGCGYAMTSLVEDDSPLEDLLRDVHASVGVTLVALMFLRLFVCAISIRPPLPDTLSTVEEGAALMVHTLLYVLPVVVLALGWAQVNLGGHGVEWFGVAMPKVFPTADSLEETAELLHRWFAYATLALAALHVAAALKHRFINRDEVFHRMSLGRLH